MLGNIYKLLEENSQVTLLDCGCDEGDITLEIAKRINTQKNYGIDIIKERYIKAQQKGIIVKHCDLNNERFPFESESIDVVHANQVIEHLWNLDNFLKEIHRVLKPGGYAVISTENLASWHNIFALLLGFQPFSSTNITQIKTIGNPFALHVSDKHNGSIFDLKPFAHLILLTYQGLKDLFSVHNFVVEQILGAGYYPFPKRVSVFLSKIDKRHAAFLTIKVRKKNLI